MNAFANPAILSMFLFVFVGLLNAGLAVPLIRRRVKPNYLYGFRTPKTLSDERIWYEANAYAGRLLLRLGIVFVVASVGLFFVFRGDFIVYNVACGSIVLGGVLIVSLLSYRHLRSL